MNDTASRRRKPRRPWFHAIDFGDGEVSPGRFDPSIPPNYTLFGFFDLVRHLDLTGARCVDVGTMDGLGAFIMKGLGAEHVTATDMARRKKFLHARRRLGLDIDYRTPVAALELPQVIGEERADVMLMAGVLYHVIDPVSVLAACRQSLRREGWLIAETSYLFDEPRPVMSFNPIDESTRSIGHANVFWRPSRSALTGMLELVGFEVVATVAVEGRITALARAKRPAEIEAHTPMLTRIHRRYERYRNYGEQLGYDRLQDDTEPPAAVPYRGPTGHWRLYRALYRPHVPFQPAWTPPDPMARWRDVARSGRFHAAEKAAAARARLAEVTRR